MNQSPFKTLFYTYLDRWFPYVERPKLPIIKMLLWPLFLPVIIMFAFSPLLFIGSTYRIEVMSTSNETCIIHLLKSTIDCPIKDGYYICKSDAPISSYVYLFFMFFSVLMSIVLIVGRIGRYVITRKTDETPFLEVDVISEE